jgi:hypothetical protein
MTTHGKEQSHDKQLREGSIPWRSGKLMHDVKDQSQQRLPLLPVFVMFMAPRPCLYAPPTIVLVGL